METCKAYHMIDKSNYSLLNHNTFGIEACCCRYLEYASVAEAQEVVRILKEEGRPMLIVGSGSNLLLTRDFPGTVVSPHNTFEVSEVPARAGVEGEDLSGVIFLRCWAGTTFDDVVAYAVAHGFHGLENLSLIPGEVGASAVQNIGAYGAEVSDSIVEVEAVELATGQLRTFTNAECEYSYRQSKFKHEWKNQYLMTYVTYQLSKTYTPRLDYGNIRNKLAEENIDHPTPVQLRQTIIDIRNAKLPDPKIEGNAGSFFMNPIVPRRKYDELATLYPCMPHYTIDAEHEKIPAGWMIDQCGWKGKSLGRAGVHDKQALVLVNRGGATGNDILTLMRTIQRDVKSKFGIDILPEVNVV